MASSREAFEKLRIWKKSSTDLKVTVVTKGIVNRHIGQIFGVDERLSIVGIVRRGPIHEHFELDLSGATFKVGARTLEAERGEDEFVAFEEL